MLPWNLMPKVRDTTLGRWISKKVSHPNKASVDDCNDNLVGFHWFAGKGVPVVVTKSFICLPDHSHVLRTVMVCL